jgi:hypothetical protein
VNRTVAALLALLAVLALGAAAATLEDTTTAGGAGGTGSDSGVGVGTGDRFDLGGLNDSEIGDAPTLPPIVGRVFAALFLLIAVFGLYAFYHEHGLKGFLTIAVTTVAVVLIVYLLFRGLGDGADLLGRSGLIGGIEPTLPGGAPAGPDSALVPVVDPPATLLALFGLVLVGAAALVLGMSGDDVARATPAEEPPPPPDVTAIGRAAGRAADRIESDADLDNAVFRAWREMTRELDVTNPAASTPAEFATAAVDAGMAHEDVDELTGLFEAVRYGGRDPDTDRERRAVDALRNIQRTYADVEFDLPEPSEDGPGGSGGSDGSDGTTGREGGDAV